MTVLARATNPPVLSDDQAEAHDRVTATLLAAGIDLANGTHSPLGEGKSSVLAVMGKAGSGKTLLAHRGGTDPRNDRRRGRCGLGRL